ncbi:MAG TPA: TetR/AcrR family transcriptional regulator [Solirubrobacterales bacterium]|nr:TetR/AcrR family transcriptional regulator [Solirubrobacterales bacterium]
MLSADVVGNFRRLRITSALAELCVEQGYRATTITHIAKRAGCARGTIYELFDNKDEIFVTLLERVAAELFVLVDESCASAEGGPSKRTETGLRALLSWVGTDPCAAWALIVEAPSGSAEAFGLHFDLLAGFAERLDRNRPGEAVLPGPVAELIVGGIASILRGLLIAGDAERAPELLPELLTYLRQPFLAEA